MQTRKTKGSLYFKIIFTLALLGLVPMFGGIGSKLGLWLPMTGFLMTVQYMSYSVIAFLLVVLLSLKSILRDWPRAVLSTLILMIFTLSAYYLGVNQEPMDTTGLRGIHDVTTDMENPPQFITLLKAPGRTNSFDYTEQTAERQKAKFPWVKPLISDLSPKDAYQRALMIGQQMNWKIASDDAQNGRFEATDYSKWYHFNDDVVVRVTATDQGSRIDLRSLTRVGGSDHGLGAKRIMIFQKNFSKE